MSVLNLRFGLFILKRQGFTENITEIYGVNIEQL